MEVITESPELYQSYRSLLDRKPNFDSSITLFTMANASDFKEFKAKDLPEWSSLDVGWTFSPPSVMSVHGYMTGINPDIVRVMSKHLGLHLNYIFTTSFDETTRASLT